MAIELAIIFDKTLMKKISIKSWLSKIVILRYKKSTFLGNPTEYPFQLLITAINVFPELYGAIIFYPRGEIKEVYWNWFR
jgi:hypothetical protein